MKRKLLIIAILSVSVLKIFGQTKIFVPGGTTNGIVSNTNATTNPNDYVGIGISSFTPSEMLHVNGGNLQINNSISQVRGSIVSNFLVSDKILAEFTSDYSNIKDVFQYRSNKLFLHRTDLATSIATESMYMGSIPISGNPMGLVSYSGNLALWAEGARNVSFYTNKRERFTVAANGNVGIGTSTPDSVVMLHVRGNKVANAVLRIEPLNWNVGTAGSTAKIEMGDENNYFNMVLGTGMKLNTTSDLIFSTGKTERMRIDATGKVSVNGIMAVGSTSVPSTYQFAVTGKSNFNGIVSIGDLNNGLSTPKMYPITSGYSLYVVGGIMSEQVKVALKSTASWSDYVFNENYKLLSLNEVEKFVQLNKHLPNFPSAHDLVKSGINMAEMDAKLLEKIEELTLHLIALDNKNEKLEKEIIILRKKIR